MRTILKIIAAPFVLALILIVAVLSFFFWVGGGGGDLGFFFSHLVRPDRLTRL